MKTILHIGTGKTGTTSIQKCLHENREVLKKNRILFTKSLGLTNNVDFPIYCLKTDKEIASSQYLSRNNIFTIEDKNKFDESVKSKLKIELQQANDIADTLVISSEHFSTTLRHQHQINHLAELFQLNNLEVDQIIIYLRDQISYLFSDFSTRVSMGIQTARRPHIPSELGIHPINYSHTIKLWSNTFPNSKIIVKIFEKNDLLNGDVVVDFFSLLNVNIHTLNLSWKNENTSLSELGLNFLIEWNSFIKENPQKNFLSLKNKNISSLLIPLVRNILTGNKIRPNLNEIKKINEICSNENEWIKVNYRPDRSSLFENNKHDEDIIEKLDQTKEFLFSREAIILIASIIEKTLH